MWYYWKSDSLRGRRGAVDAGDSAWSSGFDVYPMRITQKMIADEAGVSQSTVSMVLRDRKGFACTPDVRAKVLDAARGLRYAVPRHRTHNLGLLVHLKQASSIRFDSYYNRFFHGLVERASTLGYHLLLESYEPSVWPPAIVASRKVDGLIVQIHLAPSHQTGQLAAQLPVVMLNTRGESDEVVSLMPDNAGGLAQSVRHLNALGHRRIAYFGLPGPPVGSLHNRERYEGYLAAMRTLAACRV